MISHRELFKKHLAQTSPSPIALEITYAEGIYMYDLSGKKYLDLISGISVNNTGHRNSSVIQAIEDQCKKYLHLMVYGELISGPQVALASKLNSILPSNIDSFYFVNSGSEAIEGAMKLAKRYTGRSEFISFKDAYHGSTQGALSIIGSESLKNAFRPLMPDTRQIRFCNTEDLNWITNQTAAVVIETIQAEAGVLVPDPEYLIKLRQKCSETGALLILDEVQTAFGRTGKMFGFEHFSIVPDIIILAKGLGGGMPLGCFASSEYIMSSLSHNPVLGHITTFGGHPVCCAAALANISEIQDNNLIGGVENKETLFKALLKHPKIKEFRSSGLLMAVQFESAEFNFSVIQNCIENGVLTDWFLFNDSAMRIAPPLIITPDEISDACDVIINSINLA